MSKTVDINRKILNQNELISLVKEWKSIGKSVVFTNGCFDILHTGHLELLEKASNYGDKLVVGINSDASVKKLKGETRPINKEQFRARMMSAIQWVDAVYIFQEDTPELIINKIIPNILVKGGDYTVDQIIGAGTVKENNGQVIIIPFVEGFSTTATINSMKSENIKK